MAKQQNHRQCKHLQFWSSNCFAVQRSLLKDLYQISFSAPIFILYPEGFMLCKKAVYNGLSLELYTPFDFKLRI